MERSGWGIARANRNKSVPDFVHTPYPLRWIHIGRDDHRRRCHLSFGASSDLIDA